MEIVQNKKSHKHTFNFFDEYFNFAYEDKTGSGDIDMEYAEFPQKASIVIDENEWLRNVGYIWCVVGILQIILKIVDGSILSSLTLGGNFWLVLGVICVMWAKNSKVIYSVFSGEKGRIFVIHDKQHDKIIEEINNRKKNQLLDWYGDFNPNNDLSSEINKFRWLFTNEVISEEELNKKIQEAEDFHDNTITYSVDRQYEG